MRDTDAARSYTDSAEAYVVKRYKLWEHWQPRYDYKHVKGARIAEILRETGGLPSVALELGVGPGGVAAALSRRGIKIVGIDLSPDALVKASEHCRSENVRLMRASGFALPFRDGSLALIYASQVLHLFGSAGRLMIMREAHRVLQPGGRFVFDMKNAWSHPYRFLTSSAERRRLNFPPHADIAGLLNESGFSAVVTRPGLLPTVRWARVPDIRVCRGLAHTTFFVATRPPDTGQ